jgi:acyl carrier protein
MGLDLVELVLEVEKSFALKISDPDAATVRTVGDLIRFVRFRVGNPSRTACPTSQTFYRFRRELMDALPLARRQIRPDGDLEVLVPGNERRRVWTQLRWAGLELPPLGISAWVAWIALIIILVPPVALAWWYHTGILLALGIPLGYLAWVITRPLAIHPYPYRSIREAILYLTPTPSQDAESQASLTDNEIADKVRLIISACLGVPIEQVTDGARFVEDLGAD